MVDLSKYKIETDLSKYKLEPQFQAPKLTLAQRIRSDIQARGVGVVKEITDTQQPAILGGLKATAQLFGGVGDVAAEIIKTIPGGEPTLKAIGNIFADITNPENKGLLQDFGRFLASYEQKNPEAVKVIQNVLEGTQATGEIAGNILLAEGLRGGAVKAETKIKQVPELYRQLTTQSEQSINSKILKKYEKGVKPLINAKTTPSKLADYKEDAVNAVKIIKENKPNLRFIDETGEPIVGQTPKSLQQLSEAIEQTKKTIFERYDALAKTAGEAGVGIDTAPIINELNAVINKKSLQLTNPRAIEYAKNLQDRLFGFEKIDAVTAQEIIQNYNKSLEAFYRNPTYDSASQAAIDAMIANRMRQALDDGISGVTGGQYQALKNQYGSLKAIERDVIKATLRDARRNVKGLIDLTDIFSGGQVISGILNMSPGMIAQGITQKAIAEYFKFLTNPNRAIEQMFQAAEKLP